MTSATVRKLLWALALVSVPIGLWGLYARLAFGHEATGYGSYVVWGLWVAMYLYFMELAAGSHLFATMDLISGFKPFTKMYRIALLATLGAMVGGLLHIFFDLGHPERFVNAYLSPSTSSVMAFMVWAYTLFGLVLLAQIVLAFRPEWSKMLGRQYGEGARASDAKWLRILQIFSIPMVIAFSGGVGALFGVQGARAYWHVGMYPVAFIITALASGAGLMTFLAAFFLPRDDADHGKLMGALARLLAIFLAAEVLFVFADYSVSVYGGLPSNVAAVTQVLTGPYALSFWLVQVLIGMAIPFVICLVPALNSKPSWLGLAGALVLFGFIAVRLNAVLPALTVPELEGLRTAFVDPRLGFSYVPTMEEIALTVGIVGLALLVFLVAFSRLHPVQAEA